MSRRRCERVPESSRRPDEGQVLLDREASEIARRAEASAGASALRLVARPGATPAPEAFATAAPHAGLVFDFGADEPATRERDDDAASAEGWYQAGCDLEALSPER